MQYSDDTARGLPALWLGWKGWRHFWDATFTQWGIAAISYSLYLVHKPMYAVVQNHWGNMLEGQGVLAWLAYGLASIPAAALLYYLVERPFLRLRGVLLARRAAPVTVQAA